ncbi:MAG: hypothetical protein Q9M40_05775 [Sulfurimonas sp.]|nr:hypothetical protein [Sulfurimonas sp.]
MLLLHSPAIKTFHILKVVSDHFEPQTVTKENTKSLLFKVINDINKLTSSFIGILMKIFLLLLQTFLLLNAAPQEDTQIKKMIGENAYSRF